MKTKHSLQESVGGNGWMPCSDRKQHVRMELSALNETVAKTDKHVLTENK